MTDARGLHDKYDLVRTDGTSAPGRKHHGCRYFVLDLDHDPAAVKALQAYAAEIYDTRPGLWADLTDLIGDVNMALNEQERLNDDV